MRCGLGHEPGPAGRAKAAPLAAERDQLVAAAVVAAQAQEAVGQDAAFEEGVELVPNCGRSAPTAASDCSKKVAACCCTKRYSVVCSGRWRS